jgi:hypothetical protein
VWVTVLLVLVGVGAATAGVGGLVWLRWRNSGYQRVPAGDERATATGAGWYGSGRGVRRRGGGASGAAGGSDIEGGGDAVSDGEGEGDGAASQGVVPNVGGGSGAGVELASRPAEGNGQQPR